MVGTTLLEFLGEGIKVGNEVVDPMSMQTGQDVAARGKQKTQFTTQSADKSGKRRHKHE
ncbi:MAG: hypothetical protein P8Z75_01385 [Gammaproteobacteria bacterium]